MKPYSLPLDFSLAPKTEAQVYVDDQVEPLDIEHTGPFVRNHQGEIVCVKHHRAYVSADEGQSWSEVALFKNDAYKASDSHSLCVLQNGLIVLAFPDSSQFHFNWRKKTNKPTKNSQLFLWVTRSHDGGHSWEEPILVSKGYVAATTTLIELADGALLMSAQNMDYDNARHYGLTCRSEDQGVTWQPSNRLDIGGRGHHGGCYEGTLVELQNQRIWFLIRTNKDWFWHAYSENGGTSWESLEPGEMDCSSSPGKLLRLASGRLLLAYNPLYPQAIKENEKAQFKRVAGQFSEVAASWFREELVIRFSEDDGTHWSEPTVIARCEKAWLAYCYLFESRPGEIWLTTMQTGLKLKLYEKDFV